ncbi:KIR-like CYIR protein [Plasmodium cynomolgi strain B]|uniref:KIR-like CYIR protein n=1 Tax=Plasmodium cynomolgi (strain B) TaxID=1120755 RepID=K6ULJ7_PLACD|nr:KIR-like CYIR protein [Plasmodium cynomolgi strain B]GAB67778.1 KIR-like CYIR protein [Plasmodium cynomolgi strain B]
MDHTKPYGQWCHLFYYWLGDKVKDNLRLGSFPQVMKKIYSKLPEEQCNGKCIDIYPDIYEQLFGWSKDIFDSFYNYNVAKSTEKGGKIPWCEKYNNSLEGATTAYGQVQKLCASDGAEYCIIWNKSKEYFPNGPQNLKCTAEQELEEKGAQENLGATSGDTQSPRGHSQEEAPRTHGDGQSHDQAHLTDYPTEAGDGDGDEPGILGEKQLDLLKSKLPYYEKLYKGSTECDNGSAVKKIEGILRSYTYYEKGAEEIVKAWCNASGMVRNDTLDSEYCYALYFWIGDQVLKSPGNVTDFEGIMSEIYQKLTTWKPIEGCNNMETNIEEKIFEQRKGVFDYFQQYEIMKKQLEKRGGLHPLMC